MEDDAINSSPWIKELNKNRETTKLNANHKTDVVIVGGGISGFTSAFFALKSTNKSVTLIEAGKIGHGATGHNAGQVVDYFEKPFSEIVNEYGINLAIEGQKAIYSAWDLLEEILQETQIKISFSKFIGFAGCTNLAQLNQHFENKKLKVQGGIDMDKVRVSENFKDLNLISEEYSHLYELVPQTKIEELLETKNSNYIAVLQSQKGCMNSSLLVQELSAYLLTKYRGRFQQFEHSPVSDINLDTDHAILKIEGNIVYCEKVVLCTNGFENINIVNTAGNNIDNKYHAMIHGIVGYMAGYIEDKQKDPIAISYLPEETQIHEGSGPYFYLTRRNHIHASIGKSLICIGGPEEIKFDKNFEYSKTAEYPNQIEQDIRKFLNENFKHTPKDLQNFHFKWHGLMGYTASGIRCVGTEPINSTLLYNLGCNGIGILPSIYGSKKISDHLAGKDIPETIFDPIVQRRGADKKTLRQSMKGLFIETLS